MHASAGPRALAALALAPLRDGPDYLGGVTQELRRLLDGVPVPILLAVLAAVSGDTFDVLVLQDLLDGLFLP